MRPTDGGIFSNRASVKWHHSILLLQHS